MLISGRNGCESWAGLDGDRASAVLVAPLSRRAAAHAVLATASLTVPRCATQPR
jgi:hypothetical protein